MNVPQDASGRSYVEITTGIPRVVIARYYLDFETSLESLKNQLFSSGLFQGKSFGSMRSLGCGMPEPLRSVGKISENKTSFSYTTILQMYPTAVVLSDVLARAQSVKHLRYPDTTTIESKFIPNYCIVVPQCNMTGVI